MTMTVEALRQWTAILQLRPLMDDSLINQLGDELYKSQVKPAKPVKPVEGNVVDEMAPSSIHWHYDQVAVSAMKAELSQIKPKGLRRQGI